MSYEENVKGLAQRTSDELEALWARHMEGALSVDEFHRAAAVMLSTVRARGVAIAELTLGGYLQEALGHVPAFVGVATADTADRLTKAVATITASELDTPMQLRRLAVAEVLDAASTGFSSAIKSHPAVKGYTRGLESDACELCTWLYKDGYVYPANQSMHTHTGCVCHPVPVTG